MTDPSQSPGGERVCELCVEILGGEGSLLCPPHDESMVRLAFAFAAVFQDPPTTKEKASWFIEDAENVVGPDLQEGDGWVVAELEPLPGGEQTFSVNGKQFWIDPNAEGYSPPQPIEEYDAEDWDEDDEDDEGEQYGDSPRAIP